MASQSVRLKEEQLRREEEKVCLIVPCLFFLLLLMVQYQLREIELKVQREINEKRQELLAKEESLRQEFFNGKCMPFLTLVTQEFGKPPCRTRLPGRIS